MEDSVCRKPVFIRKNVGIRRAWCCSFNVPRSPENLASIYQQKSRKSDSISKSYSSVPGSPSPSSKLGLGLGIIDPRRILSPGRVSPIDSDTIDYLPVVESRASVDGRVSEMQSAFKKSATVGRSSSRRRNFDVRLSLKSKIGSVLVLELDSEVLCANSSVLATKILDSQGNSSDCVMIEVNDVADLSIFRDTIELMYDKDVMKTLMKGGVSRAIDILEVSSTISFHTGVISCLRYLEAVPWSEAEEEKLKSLFLKCKFDEPITKDLLGRLYYQDSSDPKKQNLAIHLIQSITKDSDNGNARRELKSLVRGLLSKSSVYQKEFDGLNKTDLYDICHSSLNALVSLLEEACGTSTSDFRVSTREEKNTKPLIGRISKQVDNLNWMLEILIDKQMGEEFVVTWANQKELLRLHEMASPMVRYELSRVSASVFIALGKGKLQCRGNERYNVFHTWFGPMLYDFGWLQRCAKGLDVRALEDGIGQTLLTLPLKHQQCFFMEWFACFSRCGSECPNLGKSFQIWWRRSFSRGGSLEAPDIEL